jgi:hypothetical protein
MPDLPCDRPEDTFEHCPENKEHLSHISRSLRELTEKGLVQCLTPNATKNRIYGLTELGQKVLSELLRMDVKH